MTDCSVRNEADLYVETGYRILHEDDFFFVVDKPAPLPVHPVGRFKEKNLLSLMKKHLNPGPEGFRIVNRLDSETSGLVIVSKSSAMAGRLGLLFEKRQVHKEYQAVVMGALTPERGTVSIPLGFKIERGHRVRTPDPQGESAHTGYEVLGRFGDCSLVKALPQTGRTHQIRAHLAFLGHPVVGDKIYIDPAIFEKYVSEGWQEAMLPVVKAPRLLLHATVLEFQHPATGAGMSFAAELPPCFDEFLNLQGTI